MSRSFGYGNLTASSAAVESHINELKNRSGIEKNMRVDEFVKQHSTFLEGNYLYFSINIMYAYKE